MTYKWTNKIQQSSIILESTIKLKFYKVNKTDWIMAFVGYHAVH